jgi:hypothetical protein
LALAIVVAVVYLATLFAVTGPLGFAFGALTQLAFVVPGVLILRPIAGPAAGWLIPLTFGPLIGQGLSSLALTGLWAAGGRGLWLLLAGPALVLLLVLPARRLAGRWRFPTIEPHDCRALSALLLVVPLVVALPFANVGAMTPDGQAYRAYFTADYVWRRAVVAEVAKGDFLPVNPYYAFDSLHYYWMPHLMTAVQYRAMRALISLDELLLMQSVFIGLCFVGCLYGFVRLFGVRAWAAAGAVGGVVVASSFEGLYAAIDYYRHGVPLSGLKNLNIDAVTRWFFQAMPIDGLQRVLLYQPHHALGYALGLLGVVAIAYRQRLFDPIAVTVAGILLGLSTIVSSFAGLMFILAAALYEGVAVVRRRDWRRGIAHAIAAAVPIAVAVVLVGALRYVDTGGSVIRFGLNPQSARRVLLASFLSIGPQLILGGVGAAIAVRQRLKSAWILGPLVLTCIVFYFFIDVRDHQDVYVGWRAGHLLFMTSTALLGILLERVASLSRESQRTSLIAIGVVVVLALPTTVIDVYNTQDISNRGQAPGFKWTLILTPDDLQAFDWIKAQTPQDAILQVDPEARDSETWAYLPAFADRRMSVGLPISMIPLAKYRQGSSRMHAMYDLPALEAFDIAARNHIDYVIVGPPEQGAHPGVNNRFRSIPDLMPVVFQNATIAIYQITQKPHR